MSSTKIVNFDQHETKILQKKKTLLGSFFRQKSRLKWNQNSPKYLSVMKVLSTLINCARVYWVCTFLQGNIQMSLKIVPHLSCARQKSTLQYQNFRCPLPHFPPKLWKCTQNTKDDGQPMMSSCEPHFLGCFLFWG